MRLTWATEEHLLMGNLHPRPARRQPMKVRPLRDQVLVKRSQAKSETEGGLLIPENTQVKSRYGEVLAVGPGRWLDNGKRLPIGVEIGQVVYFRGTHGMEIEIDDEPFVLLREDEIDGIVEEP